MAEFKSINDFKDIKPYNDSENFFEILNKNFKIGKELSNTLSKILDTFETSPLGEIFVDLPKNIDFKKDLEKYFNIRGNKIGSRGLGYYGLFGSAYLKDNRKNYFLEKEKTWESFWKEYNEYIDLLDKVKDNEKLLLVYLDNYRNFVLLWSYILLIIKKSNKKRYKINPIRNMAFQNMNEEEIDNILNNLIKIYETIIDNILSIALENNTENIFMLPNIKELFNKIKKIFNKDGLIYTKKGKLSLSEYFKKSQYNTQIWFEKIFRNTREEDNLGIIFSFLLQKKIDFNKLKDKQGISELINNFKNKNKGEYIVSALYGGIELALIAKYLGYNSGWVNYSIYHLSNKDTYAKLEDIFYPLSKEKDLRGKKEVIILDDNIGSGDTLEKIQTIFQNNHISVKLLAAPRIYLDKEERKRLKSSKEIKIKITKKEIILNYNPEIEIEPKKLKININNILDKINTDKSFIKDLVDKINSLYDIKEIRKHVALNALYFFPRVKKKGRKINVLIEKKVRTFRKKFGKEFRSL